MKKGDAEDYSDNQLRYILNLNALTWREFTG
jgi:hypothetical protein